MQGQKALKQMAKEVHEEHEDPDRAYADLENEGDEGKPRRGKGRGRGARGRGRGAARKAMAVPDIAVSAASESVSVDDAEERKPSAEAAEAADLVGKDPRAEAEVSNVPHKRPQEDAPAITPKKAKKVPAPKAKRSAPKSPGNAAKKAKAKKDRYHFLWFRWERRCFHKCGSICPSHFQSLQSVCTIAHAC